MVGSCSESAGEEDDELSDEEVALDVGVDEGAVDLDDADSSDLDIGLDLPELGDSDDGTSNQVDFDFSEFFGNEDDVAQTGDDEAGPKDFDTSIGIEEPDAEDLSDDALGVEGTEPNLDEGMTPLATNEGDEEGALETVELFIADESESAVSAEPWTMTLQASGDFEVICSNGRTLFAGGSDTWLTEGTESSRPELAASSAAVLLAGPGRPTLLVATKLGALLSIDPSEPEAPKRVDWKGALGVQESSPATLTLCRLDTAEECLALSSTGALLQASRDEAFPLGVPARPLALPRTTDVPIVLAELDSGLCLLKRAGTDRGWTTQSLPELVSRVFRPPAFEFVARGSIVVLASRQGAFVSSDGGQRFNPVAGTAATAAAECGMYRGALRVWVVISHEVKGESDLLMINPQTATAVRLARFETEDPKEDSFAPVTALCYEPSSETLYAVGAFGLFRFTPPPRNESAP